MRLDLFAYAIFILLGVGVTIKSVELDIGSPMSPKAGFTPFIGGLVFTILNAILLLRTLVDRKKPSHSSLDLLRPGILVVAMMIYIAILETVGYVIATFLVSAVTMQILIVKPKLLILFFSFVIAVVSYVVFNNLLDVRLPPGILKGVF